MKTFKVSPLVLGIIARAYGTSAHSKQRSWGTETPNRPVPCEDGDIWSTSPRTQKGVAGLELKRQIGFQNGGRDQERWFIPFEEIQKVTVSLPATWIPQ